MICKFDFKITSTPEIILKLDPSYNGTKKILEAHIFL